MLLCTNSVSFSNSVPERGNWENCRKIAYFLRQALPNFGKLILHPMVECVGVSQQRLSGSRA